MLAYLEKCNNICYTHSVLILLNALVEHEQAYFDAHTHTVSNRRKLELAELFFTLVLESDKNSGH